KSTARTSTEVLPLIRPGSDRWRRNCLSENQRTRSTGQRARLRRVPSIFSFCTTPSFRKGRAGDARRSTGPKLFKDGAMNLYLKKAGFFLRCCSCCVQLVIERTRWLKKADDSRYLISRVENAYLRS